MQKVVANKGFSRRARCCARVAQARGATEMLDRKRWFLSDCQVLVHYLGVVKALNTFELLDNKVSANSSCEEFLIKSGGTVNPAAPARKASSKETALQRQEPRVKHGVDERRHT